MPKKNPQKPSVLIVDDKRSILTFIQEFLDNFKINSIGTQDGTEAIRLASQKNIPVVILDVQLGDTDGVEVLRRLMQLDDPPRVIMLTGHGTISIATESMKHGAFDFLTKPIEFDHLIETVRAALLEHGVQDPFVGLSASGLKEPTIIGSSKELTAALQMLDQAALSDLPILLTGETGTGKELFARRLHLKSPRAKRKFLAINCGALPEHLLENELFGHVKGAFTGADASKEGLFEAASGGTLFLDEISSLPPPAQIALLRAVETGEFRKVGSNTSQEADVRLVVATNVELNKMVEDRTFRQDLYFRLCGVEIPLPPLRERLEDLPQLVEYFLNEYISGIHLSKVVDDEAMKYLRKHNWPGNIRELKQAVVRAAVLSQKEMIGKEDFILYNQASSKIQFTEIVSIQELEKEYILEVLRRKGGKKSAAAAALGIPLRTFYRRLSEFEENEEG